MSFDTLGLSAELLRALNASGYTNPTPIQQKAIPVVLEGRDVLGAAQTGTGKTAGFTLPILQRLSDAGPVGKVRPVRALILTPTRELAAQVGDSVQTYGRHLPFRSTVIFGGVKINPQIAKLKRGVDILVATPGRLLDHVGQGTLDLSKVEMLVLDEADRMLDMGFLRDIRRIMDLLPPPGDRQTLLFSATFSRDIRRLADSMLKDPVMVEVTPPNATADRVTQRVHLVERSRKRELLSFMIGSNNWRQVLVFTRTKHGANRLADQLMKDGLESAAIHGNKSQGARTRALNGFKDGSVRVLVATDIAARGIDINQLPHVVNYELPNVPEDYVHRIGRTARAGREGEALSLVDATERDFLRDIEKLTGQKIPRITVEGFEPADQSDSGEAGDRERPGRARKSAKAAGNGRTGTRSSAQPAGKARRRKPRSKGSNQEGGGRRGGNAGQGRRLAA